MNVHTRPHPDDDFATRFHDLDERAEKISRRLRSTSRRLRCTGEIDLAAYAELRAEADALIEDSIAFLAEPLNQQN